MGRDLTPAGFLEPGPFLRTGDRFAFQLWVGGKRSPSDRPGCGPSADDFAAPRGFAPLLGKSCPAPQPPIARTELYIKTEIPIV